MTADRPPQRLRHASGVAAWLRIAGVVRIILIGVIAAGSFLVGDYGIAEAPYLAAFYIFGLVCSAGSLAALYRMSTTPPMLTWAQLLVDMGVVAATVSFTGGANSVFAFLFVIVILEAGILLGLSQGYLFATLSAAMMAVLVFMSPTPPGAPGEEWYETDLITRWYGFLIQTLAYYLTASISGYWNQQIHRLQQFQHEILDNMNNGFLIADTAGFISIANKAAERILNLHEDEAVGQPIQDILRTESGDECPVITALRSGKDFTRYEYTGLIKPNTTKLLGLSTSRIYDWRNRLTGIIASFSDLTELEHMREELKRQDRLSVVGELAAGLAHEIRNPVAAIRGAVDELQNSMDKPVLAEKLISIALRESDQLNEIVTEFLDFSRNPQMRRESFDVRELVDDVAETMRRKYVDSPNLKIHTQSPAIPCQLSGDRSQIRQVFLNLAKNAIEAMQEDGLLAIAIIPGPTAAEIRFDDEGPGIPPDKVARIFEPFYTTKHSGVGMGLAICLRIITAHDGTIRAASRTGGGASLIVRLPLVRSEE